MIYEIIIENLENYICDYSKISIMTLDELCYKCGFFVSEESRNYGCNHPECEDKNGEDNKGKCFTWSCPIGWEADMEDLRIHNTELFYDWLYDLDENKNLDYIKPWDSGYSGDCYMCVYDLELNLVKSQNSEETN